MEKEKRLPNADQFENIPQELRDRPQWVNWNGNKMPINPSTLRPAKADHPDTWGTFEKAVDNVTAGRAEGIGFEFSKDDPFVGVDLDKVIGRGGEMDKTARDIAEGIGSYTETSPSGTGSHIIARGDNLPSGLGSSKKDAVEMYSSGRYFTVTGDIFEGRDAIEDRHSEVADLYRRTKESRERRDEAPLHMNTGARRKFLREATTQSGAKPDLILPSGSITVSESSRSLFQTIASHPVRKVFYHGGTVATLSGEGTLEIVSAKRFVTLAERYSEIKKWNVFHQNDKKARVLVDARLPVSTAELFLASDEKRELPPITVVTKAPVLVEDGGALAMVDKYSSVRGGILVTGKVNPQMGGDIEHAKELIDQILKDFDFLTPGDESRAVAAILTAALKMGGFFGEEPVPITLIEADASQAGKGILAKLIIAIYGEEPRFVTLREGGVGSFDESIGRAMVDGNPFVLIDNVRGAIRSQQFESLLTAGTSFSVRIPYAPEQTVEPGNFFFIITSNGIEMTRDLANRMNPVRIRKRPEGYKFTRYDEGHVVAHVKAAPSPYLGAVFDIVADWFDHGKPEKDEGKHDFRKWAGILNWIVQRLGYAPVTKGLEDAKCRASTPTLSMLRAVAVTIRDQGRLNENLIASQIIEVAEEIDAADCIKGETTKQRAQTLGIRLGGIFKHAEMVVIDEFSLSRRIDHVDRDGGGAMERKTYTFSTGRF